MVSFLSDKKWFSWSHGSQRVNQFLFIETLLSILQDQASNKEEVKEIRKRSDGTRDPITFKLRTLPSQNFLSLEVGKVCIKDTYYLPIDTVLFIPIIKPIVSFQTFFGTIINW